MNTISRWSALVTVITLAFDQTSYGISVEEDLTLTRTELDVLQKFKQEVLPILPHDYMNQDIYLIRWLRAKNFDPQEATQLLLQNLRWRNETKMDTINTEDWSDMTEVYGLSYTADGVDKQGRPFGEINLGTWNVRQAALTGNTQRFIRFTFKLLEEITQRVIEQQRNGRNVTQWKALMNMEGFNPVQAGCPLCLSAYLAIVRGMDNYYPGYADALVFINAPPSFQVALDFLKPLLSPYYQRALKVFSLDRRKWQEYLDNEINVDQRTPEFGGTKKEQ